MVAPKRAALAEANKRLDGANKKLTGIRAKVKELKDRVASLEDSLMKVSHQGLVQFCALQPLLPYRPSNPDHCVQDPEQQDALLVCILLKFALTIALHLHTRLD